MKTIALVALAAILTGCCQREDKTNYAPGTAEGKPLPKAPDAPPAPEPPAQRELTIAEQLAVTKDVASAVKIVAPMFGDNVGKLNAGGIALALWADRNGKLADFQVAKDQTSHALVMKDAQSERGKRVCMTGSIVQIQIQRLGADKVSEGLLVTDSGNLWRFVTGGSSGALVEGKVGRVCGYIVGKLDYKNSGGGVGHAVQIAGMFDLPENTKR